MQWVRWVIIALSLIDAGYMAVDGTRALTLGNYFTPSSGEHAGQLGPWTRIVEAVGVDPRSTGMKAFFVVYGVVWIAVTVAFALKQPWSWVAMLILAIGSIWYLVIGAFVSVGVITLLLLPAVRELYS
jgi:hypothetical protein